MKLYPSVEEIIVKKLRLSVEEISAMSSEDLDEHISKTIIKKPLTVGRPGSRLVPDRGSVFRTVSEKKLNRRIDSLLRA